jgi:hypothetical protein
MKNTLTTMQALATPQQSTVRTLVLGGFATLAVLMALYVYFIGNIVFDVIARREAESAIKLAQSSLGTMQIEYFNESRLLTLESAREAGLYEAKNTAYVVRPNSTAVGMVDVMR